MSNFLTDSKTRRSFLRVGASLLAVPFMETFATAAVGSAPPPKRVVFLGGGFGFTKQSFYPKKAGEFRKIGLAQGLAPLKKHRDDFTMISGMTNLGASNPHGGSESYLTGANVRGTPGKQFHNSISCDQVIAKQLGTETRFSSLTLSAVEKDGGQNSGHGKGLSLSWDGTGKPIPGFNSPLQLFQTLFAQKGDSSEELLERLKKKKSILDIVMTNEASMKGKLSKRDREKLGEYAQGIRQIEKGLERQATWSKTPKPDAPFDIPTEVMTGEEEIKLMYDMIISALQTDASRVVTYRQPVCRLLEGMELQIKAHSLSHYGFSKQRRVESEQRDKKCMELFAHFLDRLKDAKDIDGSRLFDNCIISYGTNLRSGHELKNVPALLSGGGAADVALGKHIVLPGKDRPLANYWLTLMQQAGLPAEQFSHSTGNIPELLV